MARDGRDGNNPRNNNNPPQIPHVITDYDEEDRVAQQRQDFEPPRNEDLRRGPRQEQRVIVARQQAPQQRQNQQDDANRHQNRLNQQRDNDTGRQM